MHHRQCLLHTILSRERLILCIVGIKLIRPSGLEIDGVHQQQKGFFIELVLTQDLGYHTLSMIVTPAVDMIQGISLIREIETGDFRFIVILHIALILGSESYLSIIITDNSVGDLECHRRISLWCLFDKFLAELIDGLLVVLAESKNRGDLLSCIASSTIVKHS